MPFQIIRDDITRVRADAIVNAANPALAGGGGVDGAIHRAAGPELLKACRALGGCGVGQARVTPGFNLPCKHIIHTVGPIWQGGFRGEAEQLTSCYRQSLDLALRCGCQSAAFPLISAGAYGCPYDQAIRIAIETITGWLLEHEMDVTLVIYTQAALRTSLKLFSDIQEYIDDLYTARHGDDDIQLTARRAHALCALAPQAAAPELDDLLERLDEGFVQALFRLIDERGMTDVECYKRANIDRKLFSKIRGNLEYRPSKATALAFAVALRLSLDQTRDLLSKAGYALSRASKFDIIVEYFISRGEYDIHRINLSLFEFDQNLLGSM